MVLRAVIMYLILLGVVVIVIITMMLLIPVVQCCGHDGTEMFVSSFFVVFVVSLSFIFYMKNLFV